MPIILGHKQLERLWRRVCFLPGKHFPSGDRRTLETLDFEGKYQEVSIAEVRPALYATKQWWRAWHVGMDSMHP
jgi:hypothetical protein